jgi:hypothetical protein
MVALPHEINTPTPQSLICASTHGASNMHLRRSFNVFIGVGHNGSLRSGETRPRFESLRPTSRRVRTKQMQDCNGDNAGLRDARDAQGFCTARLVENGQPTSVNALDPSQTPHNFQGFSTIFAGCAPCVHLARVMALEPSTIILSTWMPNPVELALLVHPHISPSSQHPDHDNERRR